jgi:pimeloyl-ACP methyl ester carboxylesterase
MQGSFTHRLQCGVNLAVTALLVGSCANAPEHVPKELRPAPLAEEVAAYATGGSVHYTVDLSQFTSEYGCTVQFELYRPEPADSHVAVILGHGFTRDRSNTRGWARLWASRGITVAIPSLCNSTLLNGHHDRNAEDMLALARILEERGIAERFIYAGHSAGGLSALLAARQDPRAVAYLGLDAVDSNGLARSGRAQSLPKLLLAGDPSPCNAGNNMLAAVPDSDLTITLRIPFSRHCHFEWPTDAGCIALCGKITPEESSERVKQRIRAVATAWIELHAAD